MATAVENPSIASAKEKAAAILYGNEKNLTSVIAEYQAPVKEEPKTNQTFSSYYAPETFRAERPTQYRPYATIDEPVLAGEPRVLRPFVTAEPVVEIPTAMVEDVAPVAVTSKTVTNVLEADLAEDTEYVVKFKKSTVVAVAAVVTVFVLLTVLFIVNIVSLSTTMAEVNSLLQQEQTLSQEINSALRDSEAAKQTAQNQAQNSGNHLVYQPVNQTVTVPTAEGSATAANGGFFDWLCKALSGLFS